MAEKHESHLGLEPDVANLTILSGQVQSKQVVLSLLAFLYSIIVSRRSIGHKVLHFLLTFIILISFLFHVNF
jgi:hypothetical protein